MIPIAIEIFVLPIACLFAVWIFGFAIAKRAARMYLTRRAKTLDLGGPLGCCVGIVAMPLCFLAGALTSFLCYSLMDYPATRVEPANFSGGPSGWQTLFANVVASLMQCFVAVCLWLIAFYATATNSYDAKH